MLLELKEAGTSILLITHDEHTLSRLADRYLQLDQGKMRTPLPILGEVQTAKV
jgi:ABC-type ATPase involved in cell division